jgi:sugar phosphate permease
MIGPMARPRRGYVQSMRPFPLLAAVTAAVLVGTVVDPEHWFGDKAVLVVAAYLAIAIVAFNWWELWRTRRER